jgi:hypothetical protein
MIITRKPIARLIVAVAVAALVAACGSGDDGNGGPRPEGTVAADPTGGPNGIAPTPNATLLAGVTPPPIVRTVVAIDADANTPDVDGAGVYASGGEFTIAFVIVEAGASYQGYQFDIEWDGEILGYAGIEHLKPEGLETCSPTRTFASGTGEPGAASEQTNRVAAFCLNTELAPTTFTGPVSTIALKCTTPGETTLHLLTTGEGTIGTAVQTQSEEESYEHTLTLNDATITCQ